VKHYPLNAVIPTPIGNLGLMTDDEYITGLVWLADTHPYKPPGSPPAESAGIALREYFHDASAFPRLPLKLTGTGFQRRVWSALQEIPVGRTVTYGQLAKELKTGSRAIGQACRTNPVMILVPCHRVVSAGGLGGFMGKARQLQVKRWLLEHEGASCQDKMHRQ